MTSRQQTPTQSTGAHRKPKAPAGRPRPERDRDRERGRDALTESRALAEPRELTEPRALIEFTEPRELTGRRRRESLGEPVSSGGGERAGERRRDRRAHRHHRSRGGVPAQRPERYEPYLDGLFTYCLSVLCDHDAAATALGEALALAERQRARLRDPALREPWLYALARWACLRHPAARPATPPHPAPGVAEQRRAELAALVWPEAAGTTPEQREALELAVRHRLSPAAVGHVLGLDAETARARLARAACTVERTRTALAVVDTGRCPEIARLAGDTRAPLGAALRAELVRHVDECAACRHTAERVVAAGPWPGCSGVPGLDGARRAARVSGTGGMGGTAAPAEAPGAGAVLAVLDAPRADVHAAMLHALDEGAGRTREATPGFDRRGFPLDGRDRDARRARLRRRMVTGTVVAAVVAAPALAVWAAYRAAPLGDEGRTGPGRAAPVREPGNDLDGTDGRPYEKEGDAAPHPGAGGPSASGAPGSGPYTRPGAPGGSSSTTVTVAQGAPASGAADRISVSAAPDGDATRITLTAAGDRPVRWAARTSAYWLRLSSRGGELRPGETTAVTVAVDPSLEPAGAWTAVIAFTPGRTRVTLHGSSTRSVPPPATSAPQPSTSPEPTSGPSSPSSPPPDYPSSPPPTSEPPASSPPPGPGTDMPPPAAD